jgi:hypothetical protein
MQQIAAEKRERARRETEQKILAEQLQAEREKAEIVRKTIHANAMSDAEAVAYEKKLTEEYEKKMLLERMNGEKEKWLAAINTTFSHIEGFDDLTINIFCEFTHPALLSCLDIFIYLFESHITILGNRAIFNYLISIHVLSVSCTLNK